MSPDQPCQSQQTHCAAKDHNQTPRAAPGSLMTAARACTAQSCAKTQGRGRFAYRSRAVTHTLLRAKRTYNLHHNLLHNIQLAIAGALSVSGHHHLATRIQSVREACTAVSQTQPGQLANYMQLMCRRGHKSQQAAAHLTDADTQLQWREMVPSSGQLHSESLNCHCRCTLCIRAQSALC